MIIDNLNNSHKYREAHKGFAEAFDFIKKAVEEKLPVGRYEIDGDRVFSFVQEYTSKLESSFEGHRKYIDIQFIIEGTEVIYACDISTLTVSEEYSAERDVMFLEECEKASMAVLQSGEYGIFFPWDAHKPGLCFGGNPDTVRKIVVKVRAD